MELLTVPSKTEQVANIMRTAIKKGEYKANSKLRSMRELATQFEVSPFVISAVMEMLEEEKLVRREHGRGVFVEQLSAQDEIDVYILRWAASGAPSNYDDEILKLTSPSIMPQGFNFLTRTVLKNSCEMASLDDELARINNMPNINCLLVFLNPFGAEEVKKIEKLHCPVIFIGDSSRGSLEELDINRLLFSSDSYRYAADFLIAQGHRKITLFAGNQQIYYQRHYREITEKAVAEAGGEVKFVEMPSIDPKSSEKEITAAYRPVLEASTEAYRNPCIMYGIEDKVIVKEFARLGVERPDVPQLVPIVDSRHLGGFYDAAFRLIRDVICHPEINQQELYRACYILDDVRSGRKYLADSGEFVEIE